MRASLLAIVKEDSTCINIIITLDACESVYIAFCAALKYNMPDNLSKVWRWGYSECVCQVAYPFFEVGGSYAAKDRHEQGPHMWSRSMSGLRISFSPGILLSKRVKLKNVILWGLVFFYSIFVIMDQLLNTCSTWSQRNMSGHLSHELVKRYRHLNVTRSDSVVLFL